MLRIPNTGWNKCENLGTRFRDWCKKEFKNGWMDWEGNKRRAKLLKKIILSKENWNENGDKSSCKESKLEKMNENLLSLVTRDWK